MKTNLLVLLALLVTAPIAGAQPLLNSGPLSVKLVASAQSLADATTSKTNSSSKGTTVTTVSKSTVTNDMIQTADLLSLLENSFNTTFPSGAQLVVTRTGDFLHLSVSDSTGSNVVLNLSSNLFIASIANEQPLRSGSQTEILKNGDSGASFSGSNLETVTETVVLGYDDTGLATADGTHTDFQVTCLMARKSSANLVTEKIKDTIKLEGFGNGTIRDKNVILQGSASAVINGVLFVP